MKTVNILYSNEEDVIEVDWACFSEPRLTSINYPKIGETVRFIDGRGDTVSAKVKDVIWTCKTFKETFFQSVFDNNKKKDEFYLSIVVEKI